MRATRTLRRGVDTEMTMMPGHLSTPVNLTSFGRSEQAAPAERMQEGEV